MNTIENRKSESSSRPLPSIPPHVSDPSRNRSESLDEPPPEIPQRTDARLELVNFDMNTTTTSVAAPTYDIPGAVTSSMELGKITEETDYEQPTPCKSAVVNECCVCGSCQHN